MKKAYIYIITNILNNKQYIGFTTNIKNRITDHKKARSDAPIHRAIRKYGWENFTYEVIYESDDVEHTLNTMESIFIEEYSTYKKGYNATKGGEGVVGLQLFGEKNSFYGKKHSDETKKKIGESSSKRNKGKLNPMYGKTHTKETKDKLKLAKSKLNLFGEGNNFYGKTHTDETKEKLSNDKKCKYIITFPNGKIENIKGLKDWSIQEGFIYGTVCTKVNKGIIKRGKLKGFKIDKK